MNGTPAATLLAGTVISLVGLVWDAQWHDDVGPDTFFTLPHLFLYTGSALAGITSLVVVLAATGAQRAGRPVDAAAGGPAVPVFGGTFAAPLGYLIAGAGAASFLLYGLWDQWWHTLYGFDAVLESPPHVGLLLSISVTMVGSLVVLAAAARRWWSTPALALAAAVLLAFTTVTVLALGLLDVPLDAVAAGTAVLTVLVLTTVAVCVPRTGAAAATAVTLAVMQVLLWWFAPWASRVYADAIGLPLRDVVDGVPVIPALIPVAALAVGPVIDLLVRRHRRRGGRFDVPAAGALGGLAIALAAPVQQYLMEGSSGSSSGILVATAAAAGGVGFVAGMLGQRLGAVLRGLAPEPGR
ncbi:MAG: hypothetical protein ACRDQ0_02325 [Pseudonocardia sp.]